MNPKESRRIFEIVPAPDGQQVVRTYRKLDDGSEVDEASISFCDPDRALKYVDNMIGRLKECR